MDKINEDVLRAEFERQHKGRNLKRHHFRGTYQSSQIAALWNQHKRTAEWITTAPTKQSEAGEDVESLKRQHDEVRHKERIASLHPWSTEYGHTGTCACPICGLASIHEHNGADIAEYRIKQKYQQSSERSE